MMATDRLCAGELEISCTQNLTCREGLKLDLLPRAAQLDADLGAKEAQRMALLGEVALLRSQGAKAEQRIAVLEREVVALVAQAEQSSYEHELAQQVI